MLLGQVSLALRFRCCCDYRFSVETLDHLHCLGFCKTGHEGPRFGLPGYHRLNLLLQLERMHGCSERCE